MSAAEFPGVGHKFGSLVLERSIGRGAFAEVWLARDERLGRRAVLKFLRPPEDAAPTSEDRARFLKEARIVAGFHHRHVVTLYHLHKTPDGNYALEMEYLDAGSIADSLSGGERFPADEAWGIARAVASALAEAHAAGIVHGDVKPGNVMRGSDGRVKLGDFGLSRLFGGQDLERSRPAFAGTPLYLAPEMVSGQGVAPPTDVWSFGVMLYQMLAGRLPFSRSTLFSLFSAIQNEAPSPLGPPVPPEIAGVVERCLAKRPEDRFQDGAELLRALEGQRSHSRSPARAAWSAQAGVAEGLQPVEGHRRERARLAAALDGLDAGTGGVILLTGAAGVGKSTMVASVAEDARARGWRALLSQVSPVEGTVRPLFVAARRAAAAPGDSTPRGAFEGTEASLFGLTCALESLANDRPLVVAVEDLHHASPEDTKLLLRACQQLRDLPVLWLVTERTSDLGVSGSEHLRGEPLLMDGLAERIDLGPIGDDTMYEIVGREIGAGRVSGDVLDRIVRRSAGNPFLAVQLTRHMRESGALTESDGEWTLTDTAAVDGAPRVLRELVSRRLSALPDDMRDLLDVAAVDGVEFDGEAVAAAMELPEITVLRQLQLLYRVHGLVAPRERGFRFAHPLLQEVIYREVAPDFRRALHRLLADHLESRAGGVDPERLGVHWERSDEPRRAEPWLLRAALEAANRLENFRCVDLATRAGVVPGEVSAALARDFRETLFQMASSLGELGHHDERQRLYSDLLRIADETGESELRLRVHARRGLTAVLGGGLSDDDEADVRAAAKGLPDSIDQGIAYYALGIVERMHGRLEEAEANLRAADARFVAHGSPGRHGSVLDQLGTIAVRCGRLREGAQLYAEAARACRETGRLANAAISDVNAISTSIDLGEVDGLADRLANAARHLDVDGLLGAGARVRLVLADVRYAMGDLAEARRVVDSVQPVLERVGMVIGVYEAKAAAMYFALAAGELDAARDAQQAAHDAAERLDDPRARAILCAHMALLTTRVGALRGADTEARRAVELATELHEPATSSLVALSLAEAAMLGMPADLLPEVRSLLVEPGSEREEGATARSARAFVDGMIAYCDRTASPEMIEASARVLARRDAGRCRAYLWMVADRLRAEAAARRGDRAGVEEARAKADKAAAAMGYVWPRPAR